jgi:hypothetical protein
MDPCWADLLDLGRRFIWSLCCNNQRGKRPKPLALPEFARCTRHLLQWMAWNDYANFSELDPSAAADYTQCIADEKAPASHSDEVGITVGSLALYLDILVKIFEQSAELDFAPGGVMARHPYGGRSATSVAKEYCKKIAGSIPPVPDEVFLPVVSRAFEWLGAPARDILRLIDRYEIGFAASLHVRSNSYAWHINKALLPFRFDDCGTLTEPWREPLSGQTGRSRLVGPHRGNQKSDAAIAHILRDFCASGYRNAN